MEPSEGERNLAGRSKVGQSFLFVSRFVPDLIGGTADHISQEPIPVLREEAQLDGHFEPVLGHVLQVGRTVPQVLGFLR